MSGLKSGRSPRVKFCLGNIQILSRLTWTGVDCTITVFDFWRTL